jgi:hypothetical protein
MQKNDSVNLYQQIQMMTVAEKVKFALQAGKEARSLLMKDPNRLVALAVVGSPKITEDEILLIAQSRNTGDDILRIILKNRDWMKNYSICVALVNNPKTPLSMAVSLLSRLKKREMSLLCKNKNVPEGVRANARRVMLAKSE